MSLPRNGADRAASHLPGPTWRPFGRTASGGVQQADVGAGNTAWVISRYADVREVLADDRFSADALAGGPDAFPRMDDPEHARIRRMLTREFTIKRVERFRAEIERSANDLIDQMVARGSPEDLAEAYALPMPSLVISVLLGVPSEDHKFFQDHASIVSQVDADPVEKQRATGELYQYLYELVLRKQASPGDDLISRLRQ